MCMTMSIPESMAAMSMSIRRMKRRPTSTLIDKGILWILGRGPGMKWRALRAGHLKGFNIRTRALWGRAAI
jgi:hypothetical protein